MSPLCLHAHDAKRWLYAVLWVISSSELAPGGGGGIGSSNPHTTRYAFILATECHQTLLYNSSLIDLLKFEDIMFSFGMDLGNYEDCMRSMVVLFLLLMNAKVIFAWPI